MIFLVIYVIYKKTFLYCYRNLLIAIWSMPICFTIKHVIPRNEILQKHLWCVCVLSNYIYKKIVCNACKSKLQRKSAFTGKHLTITTSPSDNHQPRTFTVTYTIHLVKQWKKLLVTRSQTYCFLTKSGVLALQLPLHRTCVVSASHVAFRRDQANKKNLYKTVM